MEPVCSSDTLEFDKQNCICKPKTKIHISKGLPRCRNGYRRDPVSKDCVKISLNRLEIL